MEQTFIEEKETSSSFDIKKYFSKLASNYYWFIITIVLFGGAAYLYIRYTVPLYQVTTFILIKQPNDAITTLGGSPFNPNPGGSAGLNYPDPGNEIFKLKSNALIGQVVDSLRLDISVVKFGRIRNKPVDVNSLPFSISVIKSSTESESPLYKLSLNPTSFKISWAKDTIQGTYGVPLPIKGDTLILWLNQPLSSNDNLYGLQFYSREDAVASLSSRIAVSPTIKAGPGMLQVSVKDELSKRAKTIIDVLIKKYDKSNFEFKTRELRTEIEFLNSRLAAVNVELMQQENQVRDFKVTHKVTDVSSSANQMLGSIGALDVKKSDNELKRYLADLVESNIKNFSGQEQVISNASGLQDAVLTTLVGRYNDRVLEKRKILDRSTPLDPRLPAIDKELQDLRSSILISINNVRQEIQANDNYLAAQERSKISTFESMPEKEKDFTQVKRLLDIKQSMYIFLMQRKEDKHIQYISSQAGDSRIIDSRIYNDILFPKPLIIYGAALGLALLLPALIILLRVFLNKKIEAKKDIENATSLPIAGEIEIEPKTAKDIIVSAGYRSDIAEQFRTLRTNLRYLRQGTERKCLLITSSMTGEGKSFVSLNLANTLSLTGKKVVLLEFDLRKPQLAKKLNINSKPGITDYVIKTDMHPEAIIQTHPDYQNLSFVTCGPVPPNPGELILNAKVESLFKYLREKYDYVVIDTPPVGIVSDAIVIGNYADISLFIIRHQYSYLSSLQILNELSSHSKLPHLSIVINAIKRNKGFHKELVDSYKYYLQEDDKTKSKKDYSLSE